MPRLVVVLCTSAVVSEMASGALRQVPAFFARWVDADVRVVDGLVHGVALLLVGGHWAVALRRAVVVEKGLALGRLHLVVLLGIVFVLLAA